MVFPPPANHAPEEPTPTNQDFPDQYALLDEAPILPPPKIKFGARPLINTFFPQVASESLDSLAAVNELTFESWLVADKRITCRAYTIFGKVDKETQVHRQDGLIGF